MLGVGVGTLNGGRRGRSALVFFEGLAEFDGGDVVVDGAVEGVGDGTGLFGDDDAQHVELLGDADGGAVAESEVGVDVEARGDGEDAAGGEDVVAVGDDGAVVEGRVFEEDGFYQRAGSHGVDALSCVDELFYFVLAFEDDEGACFALRHVHAGVDIGFVVDASLLLSLYVVFPETKAFEERFVDLCLRAHEEEETSYLGLEDDDEGDETYAGDGGEQRPQESHAQHVGGAPEDEQDDECPEDEDDIGALDHAVDIVDEGGDEGDVDDVNRLDLRENHGELRIKS